MTTEAGVELFRMPVSSFAVVRSGDAVLAAGVEPGRFHVTPPISSACSSATGSSHTSRIRRRNEVEATVEPLTSRPRTSSPRWAAGDGEIAAPVSPSAPDGSPFLVAPQHWEEMVHDGIPELDADERHVRAEVLHHRRRPARGATVVDPACSSGAMLAAIADERPDLDLIGLDASPAMVGLAAERLAGRAAVQHHDRANPLPIAADACICRALVRGWWSARRTPTRSSTAASTRSGPGGMLVVASSGAPYHVADDLRALLTASGADGRRRRRRRSRVPVLPGSSRLIDRLPDGGRRQLFHGRPVADVHRLTEAAEAGEADRRQVGREVHVGLLGRLRPLLQAAEQRAPVDRVDQAREPVTPAAPQQVAQPDRRLGPGPTVIGCWLAQTSTAMIGPRWSARITSVGTLFSWPPSTCRSPDSSTTGGHRPGELALARTHSAAGPSR